GVTVGSGSAPTSGATHCASTIASTAATSPVVRHPPLASFFGKFFANLASPLPRHAGSAVRPLDGAVAEHAILLTAFLAAAVSLALRQGFFSTAVPSAVCTAFTQSSTRLSTDAASLVVGQPPLSSAL